MKDYECYDATALAELVRERRASAEELLDAALIRLEARDGALGSVVLRCEELARRAIAEGLPEGPLSGVPFLLKDIGAPMREVPMSQGSCFFEGQRSECDAELVRRYRRAGLVIFGRSAASELGLSLSTESRLHGVTRNPWDPERSAGGSSGGAAVAVSAGIVPAAHASDGGGSIRVPASSCGLFGLKPTRARTPSGPQLGESWSGLTCAHVISRSVRDSAAFLDAAAGPAPGDPYAAPPPDRPYREEIGAPTGRLRIGLVLEGWSRAPTDPQCRAAAEDAAFLCESLGHIVEPRSIPIDGARLRRASDVIIATHVAREVRDRSEALGREPEEGELEPVTRSLRERGLSTSAVDFVWARESLHAMGRVLAEEFEQVDLILTPTMAAPPPPQGVLSLAPADWTAFVAGLHAGSAYVPLMNAAGVPAMSVPLYWTADPRPLPIGVQFAARFGGEAGLLRLASQLEQARPWFDRRPPLASL